MRRLHKGPGDAALARRFELRQQEIAAGTASTPKHAWDNFRDKSGTRAVCMAEQSGLCAYSELELDTSGLGMHLDHVKPKSRFPASTFEHKNLLLSAFQNVQKKQGKRNVFGGHARLDWYCEKAFIHPLRPDYEGFFHYGSDGVVRPRRELSGENRQHAEETIQRLNLNAPLLVNKRKHRLSAVEMQLLNLLGNEAALRRFASSELRQENGHLRSFYSAVRNLLGRIGVEVLAPSSYPARPST